MPACSTRRRVDGGYSFEQVVGVLESRMPTLTPFRRRLMPVPLGLDNPRWVDDPDFDLSNHLHRVAAPGPGRSRGVQRDGRRRDGPPAPARAAAVGDARCRGAGGRDGRPDRQGPPFGHRRRRRRTAVGPAARPDRRGERGDEPVPALAAGRAAVPARLVADALPSVFRGPVRTLRAAREVGRTAVRIARRASRRDHRARFDPARGTGGVRVTGRDAGARSASPSWT